MDHKIIMTSPYPQMTHTIQHVAKELDLPVTIVEDTMAGAARQVAKLVSKGGYEVIVSRAGTAQTISETVDLPVVHCDNSDFDIMEAFIRARKLGENIGFLTYPEEAFPYRMKTLFDVIGFDVVQLPYRNWGDLERQIEYAAENGIEIVIGGGIRALKKIREFGMQGMYITTSERIIKRALIRADEVAEYRIGAREKAERLNAVIHVSDEAILFVNNKQIIEMFNPAGEKMFGIQASAIIGMECKDVIHKKLRTLLNRNEVFENAGSLTTADMVVTYEPVLAGNESLGTVITCREISKIQQLENEIRRELHSKGLVARFHFKNVMYASEKMKNIIKRANHFALTDSTVLITGQSGTGKELIAQAVHNASQRKDGPFVAVNCAALPESLLESELFGYADGAFTGAKKGGRPGVFELAHGGTIFLDEIGEISLPIQGRLLRVLQEKEVMRVGGDRIIPVNIRVIAATNQNPWKLVKEGHFRSDLYFRINVLRIEVPRLCKRREDIPILVEHFLKQGGSVMTWEGLSENIQDFFLEYDWPGNIRQLENVVERYCLSVPSPEEESTFIRDVLRDTEAFDESPGMINSGDTLTVQPNSMEEIERQIYEQMLERFDNNRTLVAEKLGVSRTTLWKKLNS